MFRNFYLKSFLILTVLFLPVFALAQNPVSWSLESDAKGKSLKSGETFKAKVKAAIEGNWYLYAVEQPEGGPFPTRLTIPENLPFQIEGKPVSPPPITKFDPNFGIETKFFSKSAEFNLNLKASAETTTDDLAVNVRFQVCDDTLCLPPKTVKVTFTGFEDVKKSPLAAAPVDSSRQQSAVSGQTDTTSGQRTTDN